MTIGINETPWQLTGQVLLAANCVCGVACRQACSFQFIDILISALALSQPVELCFHKMHELLFGDLAILVRIHKEQPVLALILPERLFILRLWNGRLVRSKSFA